MNTYFTSHYICVHIYTHHLHIYVYLYIYTYIYIFVWIVNVYIYFLKPVFSKNECKRIYIYIYMYIYIVDVNFIHSFNTHLQVWVKSQKLKLQEVFQQKT